MNDLQKNIDSFLDEILNSQLEENNRLFNEYAYRLTISSPMKLKFKLPKKDSHYLIMERKELN